MVEAGRYSLSDEEAEGLLYREERHFQDAKLPRWHYKRLKKSKTFRVAAVLMALGLVLFLFSPSTTIRSSSIAQPSAPPVVSTTASSTTTAMATHAPAADDSQGGTSSEVPEPADEGAENAACALAACTSKRFVFNKISAFELRNLMEPTERGDLFRNSWVRLVPGPKTQKEDVIVDFSFNTTDVALSKLVDIRQRDNSLLFLFPGRQPEPMSQDATSRQFIETQTKIYFRSGLRLDQITIESTTLGINIPDEVDVWTDSANLTCTAGSLMADPMIHARYAFVTMEAGTILGTFPLYEALAMESDAGRIQAKIVPQDHKKKHGIHNARASLVVLSSAGDVDIHYKTKHGVPERDYTVNVQTDFGKITGKYLHGSYTILETVMGDIDAKILPMAADRDESELVTYTHAGRQQVTVLEPYYDSKKARLARLTSSHESKLGSLDITYPKQWEGTLEAVSKMGSVELGGNSATWAGNGNDGKSHSNSESHLQIIREQRSLLGVLLEAEKGQGEGAVVCGTERGDVKFSIV